MSLHSESILEAYPVSETGVPALSPELAAERQEKMRAGSLGTEFLRVGAMYRIGFRSGHFSGKHVAQVRSVFFTGIDFVVYVSTEETFHRNGQDGRPMIHTIPHKEIVRVDELPDGLIEDGTTNAYLRD